MAKASYKDLKVWSMGMDLSVATYEATEHFPPAERFGMMQQMRKASVSIPSNIAEGYGRRTRRQTFSFLENALGSVYELETQIELSRRLRFTTEAAARQLEELCRHVGRGLTALMRYVEGEAAKEPRRRVLKE